MPGGRSSMQITITRKSLWPVFWVCAGACLGFLGGVSATSRNVDIPSLAKSIDEDAQIAALKQQLALEKIACSQQSQTATILYEPGAPPTIALFNGAINVQPGASLGVATPSGPRWVVP